MKDEKKTQKQLIEELVEMRQRVAELNATQTELKQAEENLRESKELFEKTFVSQLDALFLLDANNPPKVIDCNPYTKRVFGHSRKEMLGRTTDFLHVDKKRRRKFQEYLYPAIAKQGFFHLPEFEMKRKDGTVFPTEHTVVSLEDEKGKRIGWMSVVRDISKQKRAEKALRKRKSELMAQAQHLEEVNAALKVLLKRREDDKIELGENVLANVKELVLPYLEKLKKNQSEPHQMTLVGIVESNLSDIVSPFATKLSSRYLNLTPTEIQVASLIKDGKTNKEIAALLHLSVNTIRSHRHNLRSKLGLKNKKMNLRSYLRSLPNE
jgi:PAS domain S-box-containing protein